MDRRQLLAELGGASPPLVLDVRSPEEYASGHVPGALHVPHDRIRERVRELAPASGRDVVVYCERGGRAAVATRTLRSLGFERVRHLEGDMEGWRKAGLPVER